MIDFTEYTDRELTDLHAACFEAVKEANHRHAHIATPIFVRIFLQAGLEICKRARNRNMRAISEYERAYG